MTSSRGLAVHSGTDQNNSYPEASYSCPSLGEPRRHPTPTPTPAPALASLRPRPRPRPRWRAIRKSIVLRETERGRGWGPLVGVQREFCVVSPSSYNFLLEMWMYSLCCRPYAVRKIASYIHLPSTSHLYVFFVAVGASRFCRS